MAHSSFLSVLISEYESLNILWVLNWIACVQVEENADFDTIKKRYRQLGRFTGIRFKSNIYSLQMPSAGFLIDLCPCRLGNSTVIGIEIGNSGN